MSPRLTKAISGFFVFAALGCGIGNDETAPFRVDTLPSGVIEIQNPSQGIWGVVEGWELKETLRLGTVYGEGPEVFGRVRDLQLDGFGRIWVLEDQAEEIRVFTSDGDHVRTFGRPGEGPGEFGSATAMVWSPDDHLWVVDRGPRRISIFDTTGTFVSSRRRPNSRSFDPWRGGINDFGFFYDLGYRRLGEEDYLVRFDTLLNALDTIPVPRHPDGPQVVEVGTANSRGWYSIPFSGWAIWTLTPDGGMWVAITDQYKLLRLSAAGDTLRVVTKSFDKLPVTAGEKSEAIESFRSRGLNLSPSQIPDFKPAISHILLDDQSNLWVIPRREEDELDRLAQIFDSSGVYLGEVKLPVPIHGRSWTKIRGGTVVTVTTDSLGVPFVVRMEIQRSQDS